MSDVSASSRPVAAAGPSRSILRSASLVIRGLVGLGVLAAAFGILSALMRTAPEPPLKPQVEERPRVLAVALAPVSVRESWDGYGTARAFRAVEIPAQISARVVDRPSGVEPGLSIRAGELILRLDDVDVRSAAEAARQAIAGTDAQLVGLDAEARRWSDQLELAQDDAARERDELERTRSAVAAGAATDMEVDRRASALARMEREIASIRQQLDVVPSRRAALEALREADEARLRMAEENLARATIVAPFDAVIQEVGFRPGELVSPGARVARLVDLSAVEIPLQVPLSAAREIREGATAALRSDSRADRVWEGRIARVAPEGDPLTRTITAYVVVEQDPASPEVLRPGQFVAGRVSSARARDVLVVPRRAIEGGRVFVAEGVEGDGAMTVGARTIEVMFHVEHSYPGLAPGETQWAVASVAGPEGSVRAGDRVIVSNLTDLRVGMRIDVSDARGPAGGEP